jgi:hypothetical protein
MVSQEGLTSMEIVGYLCTEYWEGSLLPYLWLMIKLGIKGVQIQRTGERKMAARAPIGDDGHLKVGKGEKKLRDEKSYKNAQGGTEMGVFPEGGVQRGETYYI